MEGGGRGYEENNAPAEHILTYLMQRREENVENTVKQASFECEPVPQVYKC